MKKYWIVFIGIFFWETLWSEKTLADFHRGVVLPLYGNSKTDYTHYLKEIQELNASHISFLIRCYMNDQKSNQIMAGFGVTPSDHHVELLIQKSRALGLKVTLLPVVFLAYPKSDVEWRGNLAPENWEEWWESYTCFLMHYAHLANRSQASVLSIGSELATTEIFTDRWKQLIQSVRSVFSGHLTYSANWDHYEEVTFARELDFLGVSGYYELTKNLNPNKEQLREGWQRFLTKLVAWAEKYQKPLVFMEVGYASQNGCASKPWNYFLSELVDLAEQDLCFEVLFEVWENIPCFHGLYAYHWWGEGGPSDNGYNLRQKPAANRLRDWFAKMRNQKNSSHE